MRKRCGMLALLLLAFLLLGGPPLPAAVDASGGSQTAAKPATVKVEKGPLHVEVAAKGVFEAEEMTEVVLRPEVWTSFQVLKAIEHGTPVKKGDVLLTLDPDKLDRALRDLEADRYLSDLSLKQAEEELAAAEKLLPLDVAGAELAKKYADEDLKRYMEVDRPMIEKGMQFLAKSSADLVEYAKEELRQLEKMYKAKDLTEETEEIILRRQRNELEAAQFKLKDAEWMRDRTLNVTLPRRDQTVNETAQKQAITLEKAKATLPMSLAQKKLSLDKLRYEKGKAAEKFKQMQSDRELLTVKSPADGIVYYGKCSRGQWTTSSSMAEKLHRGGSVMPEEVIFTVVKPRPLIARATIEEKDLHFVKKGMTGKASAAAFPDLKLPVTVSNVAGVPLSAGSFELKLTVNLPKDAESLMPGMTCSIKLAAYHKDDALTVPVSAVFTDEGDEDHPYVYVAGKDGKSEKRGVTIGKKTASKAEILQGLAAGDEILAEKPDGKKGTP